MLTELSEGRVFNLLKRGVIRPDVTRVSVVGRGMEVGEAGSNPAFLFSYGKERKKRHRDRIPADTSGILPGPSFSPWDHGIYHVEADFPTRRGGGARMKTAKRVGKAKGKEGAVGRGEDEGAGCKTKEAWPRH